MRLSISIVFVMRGKEILYRGILLFTDETLAEAGWNAWQIGNPKGKPEENCGVTFRNGALGDFVCSIPRTFFCEIGDNN